MLCERCQRDDAIVHLSTFVHSGPDPVQYHYCAKCAEALEIIPSDSIASTTSTQTTTSGTIIALSPAQRAKIGDVDEKLIELDPIMRGFCTRRGYTLSMVGGLIPGRRAWARGDLVRYIDLTTDTPYHEILKRGFFPEMAWSLYASAAAQSRVMSRVLLHRVAYDEFKSVLEQHLEEAATFLSGLSLDQVAANGRIDLRTPPPLHTPPTERWL